MGCYKNICLVDTPYALSIYLLKISMDDIKKTLFFIGDSVNVNIAKKLPHYVLVRNQSAQSDWKYMSWLRFYKYIKCCYYGFTNLYVQDHLYIASQFIGHYKYVNLPDSPECYSTWEKSPYQPWKPSPKSLKQKIKNFLSHGAMYDLKYGMNNQCINRWVMNQQEQYTLYMKGRKSEVVNAADLWRNADIDKKELLKNVFYISEEDITRMQDAETIILTQPLREDCKLTNKEMYDIYAPYIRGTSKVIIKPHPRDKFDWGKSFNNVYVLESRAPMQLLNYMGFAPKRAMTVSSSSISAMPESTEKIYLGTKINDKIFQIYGDL